MKIFKEEDQSPLFNIRIPLAKFKSTSKKTGKISEQICTQNNSSRWKRWGEAEIKAEYKQILTEMFIPEPDDIFTSLTIEFTILRHQKRKLDADNPIVSVKWFNDTLVSTGWLTDDDQVTIILKPSEFHTSLVETMYRVRAFQNQ
ncbi:MAG: hypothetical protein U9N61_10145 [Euryarchaeota archaeon]|nr:hypothetical protein [Euryarchaeota archaeon]